MSPQQMPSKKQPLIDDQLKANNVDNLENLTVGKDALHRSLDPKLNNQLNNQPNNQLNDQLNNDASTTEIYRPQPTQVLYSTLLDDTPISPHHSHTPLATDTLNSSINKTDQANVQTENTIIFDTIHLNPPSPLATPAPPATSSNASITKEKLTKTHKSEALTDNNILATSHQVIPSQDSLADDSNAIGSMIEHLGVAIKQWDFSVNWERTNVPKSGFINQFKKKTEILDLDLACLLCNRYGEVLERVWFKNMRDQAESVRHHGDELLGSSAAQPVNEKTPAAGTPVLHSIDRLANQERVSVYFAKIPPHIFHVVFVLSSFQPQGLKKAKNGVCQLVDDEGNIITELSLSSLAADCSALRVATLTRSADSWRFHTDFTQLTAHKLAAIEKQVSDNLVRTAK